MSLLLIIGPRQRQHFFSSLVSFRCWSVCQCALIAVDQTHRAAFMLPTKAQTSLNQSRSWLCLCCTEWFWFSLHSGWKTTGLGGPGRQSHHCAVGLEEGGEALCYAVSTVVHSCLQAFQHAACAIPTTKKLWQTFLLILKIVWALFV